MNDLENLSKKDFDKINSWGLDLDPFVAVKDFSFLKCEQRWQNKEQIIAYNEYVRKRKEYIKQKDFDNYYREAVRPIQKIRWQYLMLRKSWFITPLGWENIAINGGLVADLGMGDGDIVQRLIDYCIQYWEINKTKPVKIHIVGIDLNISRVENAKKLVESKNPNITFEFHQGDFVGENLNYPKENFDYSLVTGVFEILNDAQFESAIKEISRVTKKGLYVEDVFEKFPGGCPRDTLGKSLLEVGFITKERHVIFSEPFSLHELQDPRKLWPNLLEQNIWAEKIS
tara:strand:- start:34 stop:888 length:855 start_codon:yes stop_codon:yes gene_type:complete